MIFKLGMALIITVVEEGFSSKVIDAAKKAGAEGATVLQGRGTSIHENECFLGINIQPGKEIVLIIVKKLHRKNIMKEIVRACNLSTQGKGLTFCVPIDELAGSPHLLKKRNEEEKQEKAEEPKEENKQPKDK